MFYFITRKSMLLVALDKIGFSADVLRGCNKINSNNQHL